VEAGVSCSANKIVNTMAEFVEQSSDFIMLQ
jgi:hypothetical protein